MGCPSFMRYYMASEIMITVEGTKLPCPSAYEWSLQDVSAGESGRTDDALMHKNRVAQKRKLKVEWVGKDWQETSTILQSVQKEYLQVRYPDMLSGQYETRTFYVGDRTTPVKLWFTNRKLIEKISFDFIER